MYIAILWSLPVATQTITIDGSTGAKPLLVALSNGYQQINPDIEITIGAGLSPDKRSDALYSSRIDIVMASHGLDMQHINSLGLVIHRIAKIAKDIAMMNKSGQMAKALATTTGALGMTTMVRVTQSEGRIIPLHFNGVAPSAANIATGENPFSRDIFIVTAAKVSAEISDFLEYIRSPNGQNIMRANNAVAVYSVAN